MFSVYVHVCIYVVYGERGVKFLSSFFALSLGYLLVCYTHVFSCIHVSCMTILQASSETEDEYLHQIQSLQQENESLSRIKQEVRKAFQCILISTDSSLFTSLTVNVFVW